MIPFADNLPHRRIPVVTLGLIGVATVVFGVEIQLSDRLETFLGIFGLVPARFGQISQDVWLSRNPAALVAWLLNLATLITSMFFHQSFAQLVGNGVFLWVFGRALEETMPQLRFLFFYLMAGASVGFVQMAVAPSHPQPLVGANGAIASVIGAYLVRFPRSQISAILPMGLVFMPTQQPAYFYGFWWLAQQVFYPIGTISNTANTAAVAYWSHAIGLLIGAIWALLSPKAGNAGNLDG
jgi:membrane associated rhomboid family serine protease